MFSWFLSTRMRFSFDVFTRVFFSWVFFLLNVFSRVTKVKVNEYYDMMLSLFSTLSSPLVTKISISIIKQCSIFNKENKGKSYFRPHAYPNLSWDCKNYYTTLWPVLCSSLKTMFSYINISKIDILKRKIQTCRMRNSAEEEVIKKKVHITLGASPMYTSIFFSKIDISII